MFDTAIRLCLVSILVVAVLIGCQFPGQVDGGSHSGQPLGGTVCSVGDSPTGVETVGATTRAHYRPLSEGEPPQADHFTIRFLTAKASASNCVQVPASGQFEVELTQGTDFSVIDGNALDGYAKIALPPRTYDLYVKSNSCQNATIDFADDTYLQSGMLDADAARTLWFHIGFRIFPIDTQWELGSAYRFHFTSAGAVDTELRLYNADGEAELPPGMRWIDERGGQTTLPGVATLSVPAGALSNRQLIRLVQRADRVELGEGYHPISPVLSVEPHGLQFSRPAYLDLEMERTPEVQAERSSIYCMSSEKGDKWEFVPLPLETVTEPNREVTTSRAVLADSLQGIPILKSDKYFLFTPVLGFTPLYEAQTEHYVIYVDVATRHKIMKFVTYRTYFPVLLSYIKYALEKAYDRYWSMQTSNPLAPVGYPYHDVSGRQAYKLPVFITPTQHAITSPALFNLKFSSIFIGDTWGNNNFASMISTVCHEVFHQYQYACMGSDLKALDLITKFRSGTDKWFLEGPARYMGLAMLFEAKAERFQNDNLVAIPPDLDSLSDIQQEFNANWLLMSRPLNLRELQAPEDNGEYQTSILFAAIGNYLGYPVLLDIAKVFPIVPTPESAIASTLAKYSFDLSSAYDEAALIGLRPERYFKFPSKRYAPIGYRYRYPSSPDPIQRKMLHNQEESFKDSLGILSARYYAIKPVYGDRVKFELKLQPHQRVRLLGPKDVPMTFVSDGDRLDIDPAAEYQLIVSSAQPRSSTSPSGDYEVKLVLSRTPPGISSVRGTYGLDPRDSRFYRSINVSWTSTHGYEDHYTVSVFQQGGGNTPVYSAVTTHTGRQHQLSIATGISSMPLGEVRILASSGASAEGHMQ